MMRKIWLLSGVLMIALLMVGLNAEDSEAANQISGECGQDATDTTPATHVTFSFDESTGVMTINGDGAMKDYGNIADRPWNSYKDDIKTVVITGVSSVGKYAFDGCSSLQSILLGDSVTEIKDFAFQHCESLTYVDLNKVETLHTQTFFDCKNLKDVVINESTKRIGMQSFEDCISLESIIVPDSITYLGSNVFDYSSLKRISVGNGLSSAVFNKLNHSFNGPMYDTDGTTELNRDGVKGCVFLKVDGKLVKQETYRATFVVNSSNWKILQYGVGETIASPTPTKDGQTFERWNPALPATMPAENVTFNAVWSVKLTIKCVDMNGNPIAEDIIRNIECGSEYREEAPVIVGYVPEEQILEGKVNDEDSTVYLVYKHCYEIVFDPNNGDEPSRYSVEEGKTVAEPTNPIKEGFTFEGWLLNGVEYDFNKPVTSNITLVAKWATIQYTITIAGEGVTVKNGEDIIASGTTVDYDTILTIILSEKTGHTGTVKVGDEVINGIWTVKGDVTFTGSYSINSYKITFDTDGGSEIPEMTIEFDGTVATPENPTKEGYTFAGWDKEIPATMPAENMTIKAKWTPIKYTVSYEDSSIIIKNGETTIVSGTEIDYNTILTVTAAYVEGKTGIIKVGEETVNGTWTVKGNVTFTITYVTSVYDVVFNPDNGNESDNCSVEHGKTVAKPETPVKKGFTFLGWFLNDTEYDFEKPVTENMTIVAKWGALPFTITFNADDVTVKNGARIVNNGETIDSGTVLTVTAINHAGYTVVRIKAGEITLTSETFIVEGDVEFSVEYSINEYTISFDTDGGSEIPEMTIEFDGTVATPENPTKEGYTFAGWDKEIPATMPAENLTIKATWIINQYTITIVGEGVTVKNGEDIVASGTSVDYNTVLTVIIAEKDGYTGTVKVEDTVVNGTWTVKGDTTFTGTYSINQYVVTIKGEGVTVKNGETAISSGDKVDHGTELTITIAEKDGYTGTVKAEDTIVDGTWTITDNVTFKGIYDEKPSSDEDKSITTIIAAAVVIIGIVAVGGYFFVNRP